MKSDFSLIRKLYLGALIPNIIAVLGGTINVFFDGLLVGRRLGNAGLEAVNQTLPVYLVLCAVGSLIASGAAQLSAMAFGSDNKREGKRIFGCAMTLALVAAAAVCAVGLAAARPLARLLSTGETFAYALTYLRVTLICGVFKVMLYVPYFYLRLEGRNKRSMAAMLFMTVLNIALDCLFLFIYDWGVAGAAWASGIATAAACVLSFLFLCTRGGNFSFSFALPKRGDYGAICRFGAMMALNNVLSAVKIFAVNKILALFSYAGATAAFAVVNNLSEFSVCVQNGVPQASGAMTGILYAEKDAPAVKGLLKTQIAAGAALSLLLAAAMCSLSGEIGGWFGSTADVRLAVCLFAAGLIPATFNNTMCYYYNATGSVLMSNVINVSRGCFAVVLFCFAFSGLGQWVWLFYPAAELFTAALFLFAGSAACRRRGLLPFYLLDAGSENEGRVLAFSAERTPEGSSCASIRVNDFCEENGLPPKTTMAVSLSVEEMLTVLAEKVPLRTGRTDVRVRISEEEVIVRIRSGGRRYNPIALAQEEEYLGMRLLLGLAERTEYQSALGVNTFVIFLRTHAGSHTGDRCEKNKTTAAFS